MYTRFTTFQGLYSIKPGVKLLKTTIRSIRFFYEFADISVFFQAYLSMKVTTCV